jgi:hypothetical protein
MVHPVIDRDARDRRWLNSIEATDVEPKLIRLRPAPVVCVYPATRAEEVLRRAGIEAVHAQQLRALEYAQSLDRDRTHDCSFAATQGAGASARIHDAVRQVEFQYHAAAVAARAMRRLYDRAAYLANWIESHELSQGSGAWKVRWEIGGKG